MDIISNPNLCINYTTRHYYIYLEVYGKKDLWIIDHQYRSVKIGDDEKYEHAILGHNPDYSDLTFNLIISENKLPELIKYLNGNRRNKEIIGSYNGFHFVFPDLENLFLINL
jgi:hypothetical protein